MGSIRDCQPQGCWLRERSVHLTLAAGLSSRRFRAAHACRTSRVGLVVIGAGPSHHSEQRSRVAQQAHSHRGHCSGADVTSVSLVLSSVSRNVTRKDTWFPSYDVH